MGTPIPNGYENQGQLFFRDKIAWENAIRQYNGSDPLEMWYNYICWYDYNNQIDPENKFREALEKCLTLFEHVECYKQDLRLVKLWIKYIDLQPNPLNLYQLLYQRGIGIRCACFYVGWAHYYDSANAFKQAESVYNLGFQAQAEPYCDLQEAHNKFRMSVSQRMLYNDSSSKKREQTHLIEQRHQITTLQQQHLSSSESPQYQIQTPTQLPQNNVNDLNYVQHQSSQVGANAIQQSNQYNVQNNAATTVQTQNQSDTFNNSQQFYNSTQNFVSTPSVGESSFEGVPKNSAQLTNSIENFNNNNNNNNIVLQSGTVEGIQNNKSGVQQDEYILENVKVPPNFAFFSYNNYETWKPLLYLEEPYDENRICMYKKHLVYPSEELEYSPEELRAQSWRKPVSIQKQETIETKKDEIEATILNESQNANISNININNNTESIAQNEIQTNNIVQSTNENSFYVGDLEEQIEASTIRYASDANGGTKNKVIKIKFRKDNSFNDTNGNITKEPKLEMCTPKTKKRKLASSEESDFTKGLQSDHSKKESKKIKIKNIHDDNSNSTKLSTKTSNDKTNDKINTKFNNSVQQYNENANSEFNTSLNEDTFDNINCSTPFKKLNGINPHSSFRRSTANSFHQNDDSMCFEQNSFFASEYDDELVKNRLEKALNTIEYHLKKPAIDPFNSELCKAFLTKLDMPSRKENDVYKLINNPIPKLGNTKMIAVADVNFSIEKEVGKGAYGNVYKALNLNTSETVAIKYQRPPNVWELYICIEVSKRIKNPAILSGFMDISTAAIAPNASIFVTEFSSFGSLLDINNKVRQSTKKVMHESLVIHFSIQMLQIIQHLHSCKIIHADIKPDNFLLMRVPSTNSNVPSLRLIDFGCAIDMTLFPENTQFKKIIQTEGFTCTEMQEGREWSYQTDLFCAAGTIHVLLFGEYMQINKKFDLWDIKQKVPRYLKKHLWGDFFTKMLNIKDIDSLPNLQNTIDQMEDVITRMDSELQTQIRALSNILHRR